MQSALRSSLRHYARRDDAVSQLLPVLDKYAGNLYHEANEFTYDDGRVELLIQLTGVLPVTIYQSTYHCPVSLWLPLDFPLKPPMVFVLPSASLAVKPGPNVDPSGKVSMQYLEQWARKPEGCSLLALIQELIPMFAARYPVVARQQRAQPPRNDSPASSRPPPPPQIPGRPLTTHSDQRQLSRSDSARFSDYSSSTSEAPPPRPPPPPSGTADSAHIQPPSYRSPPPLPAQPYSAPTPFSSRTGSIHAMHDSARPSPPPPPPSSADPRQSPYAPGQPPNVNGHRYSSSSSSSIGTSDFRSYVDASPHPPQPPSARPPSQRQSQTFSPSPQPPYSPSVTGAPQYAPYQLQTPALPQQPPSRQSSVSFGQSQSQPNGNAPPPPPSPYGYTQQQLSSPIPPSPAVNRAPPRSVSAYQLAPTAKRAVISNILDAEEDDDDDASRNVAGAESDIALQGTLAHARSAPPPLPPNPAILALRAELHSKLTASLSTLHASTQTELHSLQLLHSDLSKGGPAIADEMQRLTVVRDVCENVRARYEAVVKEAEGRVREYENRGEGPEVDEIVCSSTVVYNQLLDLVAEDAALEDTIYHLGRGLNSDSANIDLDRFLKRVRTLAREQFLKRATINKILMALQARSLAQGGLNNGHHAHGWTTGSVPVSVAAANGAAAG